MVQSGETSVLELKGTWTVERARDLKDILLEAMRGSDRIVIEIEDPLEIDLSFLQLLCSAHRSALNRGKQMALHFKRSGSFGQVVHDAGFAHAMDRLQAANRESA